MNVVLIGCGKIGGLCDWDTETIQTYAKAFKEKEVNFSVYDTNQKNAYSVANRYGAKLLQSEGEIFDAEYDIAVVSSPTETHFQYLKKLFRNKQKLIVCEKPVSYKLNELNGLEAEYELSNSRVLVNFHRRFQPKMQDLALRIKSLEKTDRCKNIVVTYQRGFHNNGSHAIDLLQYLFGESMSSSHMRVISGKADEFYDDPTVNVSCEWAGRIVSFIGLSNVRFSHFEVMLYFTETAISLREGGNLIEFFEVQKKKSLYYPLLESNEIWIDALKNPMQNVVNHVVNMVSDEKIEDNFIESVQISKKITHVLGTRSYD